jgi:tetratricopeptide (TPR) repeat protein
MLKSAILALLIMAAPACLFAGPSEDLFAKSHKAAKESEVAAKWYAKLPTWVSSLTAKNTFPQTHLPFTVEKSKLKNLKEGVNKFEIRDANKKQFSAYLMVQNGTDANGRPVFEATTEFGWLDWKGWPAKYILETYPVDGNTDNADLIAFAAWLYSEKENEYANRVLTAVHDRDKELAPLIEAYICDKEKWTKPADGMKVWNMWDVQYQKERNILVSAEDYDKRLKAREKGAADEFKALVTARGEYKGRPPRKSSPTKQLVLLEWDIKQYKIAYASSDFLKDVKNTDKLQEVLDSITDDLSVIKENMDIARGMAADGNANDMQKKAEFMEDILKIDPMDLNLRGQVAEAWYTWAKPADHGNSCDRADGCKKAIPHYEIILKAYPRNTAFLLRMGKCYQALEDTKHARPYYELVIEIDGTKGNAVTAKALLRNMDMLDQNRGKEAGKK